MTAFALINEYLSVNANVITDHTRSATLTAEATALDSTAMGDGWTEVTFGLKSGQLVVELNDDAAAAQIDSIFWPLLGTLVPFEVRPDAGAVSASNPKYTGSIGIQQFAIGGSLNEMARKQLTFPTSGVVTRGIV